jgi:spoIIIJ-associated protein
MIMKKIEAPTLEEAYKRASLEFDCSITELKYEIIQYPTKGFFGLFKKKAIIVVAKKSPSEEEPKPESQDKESITVTEQINDKLSESEDSKTTKPLVSTNDDSRVLDTFFDNSKNITKEPISKHSTPRGSSVDLSKKIENSIKKLMDSSCFNIDTVRVNILNGIANVFIDGKDAALLIGKEGYRYNALSYMLFNWINDRYGLYLKLEIAEFIKTQEEMIDNYLKPIIEHIEINGRGKTKPLDGILVQIALEKLRDRFPNKYVAIKTSKDNKKFIVINNFNTTKS